MDITFSPFTFALLLVVASFVSFAVGILLKSFLPNFTLTKGPKIKIPFVEWPTRKYRDFEQKLRLSRNLTNKFIHDPSNIKLLRLMDLKTKLPDGCTVNEILVDDVKVVVYVWNNISNNVFCGIKHDEADIPQYLQIDKEWEFKYWKYENVSISCNQCKQQMKLNYVKDITNKQSINCTKCERPIGNQSLIYSCSCSSQCNAYCTTCAAKNDEHVQKIVQDFSQNESINVDNDVTSHDETPYQDAETVEIKHGFAKFLVSTDDNKENHGSTPRGVIISIHGGGYIRLSATSIASQCAQLSRLTNMECVSVEYRKAPENPLPAPMDDVIKVYEYYLKKYNGDSKKIVFQGNSAGAGMVLLLLQRIRDNVDKKNLPLPLCAICISPCGDLTGTSTSLYYNKSYDSVLAYRLNGYTSMQNPGNFVVGNWNTDVKDQKFLLNPLSRLQRRNIYNVQNRYQHIIKKEKENPHKKLFGFYYYYCCGISKDALTKNNITFETKKRESHFYHLLNTIHRKCILKPDHEEHKNVIANYKRLDDHKFNPIFGEFFNLCPIYFTVGQHEILLHDTLKCIQKCKMNNIDCEFEILSYGCHTYPIFSDLFPEANEANARIGVFISKHYYKANNKKN